MENVSYDDHFGQSISLYLEKTLPYTYCLDNKTLIHIIPCPHNN